MPSFRRNPANAGTVETIDSLWVAMIVALSLKAVLLQPFTIPSGSMEDTLQIGDYILVKKYEYGYSLLNKTARFLQFKKPEKGDILVFVYPKDPSKDFIKRCRGVAGDVLEYKDKVLYVNGVKQEEPFVKHDSPNIEPRGYKVLYSGEQQPDPDAPLAEFTDATRDNFGPVTVLPGHYFMMGDNRDNSWDSRYWGQLDEKLIKGKAWAIYWHHLDNGSFFTLAGFVVAAVFFLLFVLAIFQKPAAILKTSGSVETGMSPRNLFFSAVLCLAVSGVLWLGTGTYDLKENLKILGSRIFTVVR
jgi:signal peptidase I